jgi:molecular chaperone HscB
LHGIDITEEGTRVDDPELLAEILEIREALESNLSIEELQKMQKQNQELLKEAFAKIDKFLTDKDFQEAKNQTIRVQYLVSVEKELADRLPAT